MDKTQTQTSVRTIRMIVKTVDFHTPFHGNSSSNGSNSRSRARTNFLTIESSVSQCISQQDVHRRCLPEMPHLSLMPHGTSRVSTAAAPNWLLRLEGQQRASISHADHEGSNSQQDVHRRSFTNEPMNLRRCSCIRICHYCAQQSLTLFRGS